MCGAQSKRSAQTIEPGVIAVIQTFGDRINFYPHLHFLVTEGGVDEAGVLYKLGVLLSPALGAVFMSLSTVIVAVNAKFLLMNWIKTCMLNGIGLKYL